MYASSNAYLFLDEEPVELIDHALALTPANRLYSPPAIKQDRASPLPASSVARRGVFPLAPLLACPLATRPVVVDHHL